MQLKKASSTLNARAKQQQSLPKNLTSIPTILLCICSCPLPRGTQRGPRATTASPDLKSGSRDGDRAGDQAATATITHRKMGNKVRAEEAEGETLISRLQVWEIHPTQGPEGPLLALTRAQAWADALTHGSAQARGWENKPSKALPSPKALLVLPRASVTGLGREATETVPHCRESPVPRLRGCSAQPSPHGTGVLQTC